MILTNSNKINLNFLFFLFLSLPILSLITFLFSTIGIEIKDLTAYLRFLFVLIYIFYDKNNRILHLFLFLYLFAYVLFTDNGYPFTSKANFMINFTCFLSTSIFFYKKGLEIPKNQRGFKITSLMILSFFVISAIVIILNGVLDIYGRVYLKSFMSVHSLGYVLVAFSIYSYFFKKNISYILLLFSVILGSRTVVFMVLIFVFYILFNQKKKLKILYLSFIFCILFYLLYIFLPDVLSNQIEYYLSLFYEIQQYGLKDDSVLKDVTSSRSTLFDNMLFELQNWSFYEFFIGKGPLSSVVYNYKIAGVQIWMHNDFLDTFYSYGIIGFSMLIYTLIKLLIVKNSFVIVLIIIVSAFLNGFYTYYPEMYISLILLYNQKNKFINV